MSATETSPTADPDVGARQRHRRPAPGWACWRADRLRAGNLCTPTFPTLVITVPIEGAAATDAARHRQGCPQADSAWHPTPAALTGGGGTSRTRIEVGLLELSQRGHEPQRLFIWPVMSVGGRNLRYRRARESAAREYREIGSHGVQPRAFEFCDRDARPVFVADDGQHGAPRVDDAAATVG
jgi:hypothetical protein